MIELEAAFRSRQVMVTGGLGFIGSNLAHRLVDLGAKVLIVDSLIPECGGNLFNVEDIKDRVEVCATDLRDRDAMSRLVQGQEFVFNLAGQVSHVDSMTNPYDDLELNCRSHISLLEACRHHNPETKVVYASTRQIYGAPERLPVAEGHPLRPMDINGIHKMAGEWYHILYNKVYGLRTVSLRLTNTYGPRIRTADSRQGFMGWFIRQAVDGEEIAIFGDGAQKRDLTYVDDVVEAFLLAAVKDEADGEVYNLGGTEPVSLRELVEVLLEVCGNGSYRLVPFPEERKRIDIGDYYADYSKIKAALGWEPRVPLREGLARTVEYYRKYREHY